MKKHYKETIKEVLFYACIAALIAGIVLFAYQIAIQPVAAGSRYPVTLPVNNSVQKSYYYTLSKVW